MFYNKIKMMFKSHWIEYYDKKKQASNYTWKINIKNR